MVPGRASSLGEAVAIQSTDESNGSLMAQGNTELWNPMYEQRTPDQSSWKGRESRDERCGNSFAQFVANAKRTKEGKAHLEQHHGGFGL